MKQIFKIIFLIAAVFAFVPMLAAQNPAASITEITGTVEVKRAGAADWSAARVGIQLAKDTMISTGFRSTALLTVGNSTILVSPLTRLSLDELINQNQTETININLNTGRVRVDVNPPAGGRSDFNVQSPAATASVRGTSFEMDTVSIRVTKGSVGYASSAGAAARTVTVNAGQESWVDTDTGRTVNPMAAADANRSLPGLAGQSGTADIPGGARVESPYGIINVDVIY